MGSALLAEETRQKEVEPCVKIARTKQLKGIKDTNSIITLLCFATKEKQIIYALDAVSHWVMTNTFTAKYAEERT